MITAGLDAGSKTVKALILKDGQVVGRGLALAGFDTRAALEGAYTDALAEAGLTAGEVERVVATGAGREEAEGADGRITEVKSSARGALFLFPSARTVIDVGAEEGRSIKCDADGKILDFAVNEKCAAGAGSFTESMARALEVDLEELGPLSLRSTSQTPMNAQCAVFAESEVVSLLHARTPKEDIARAVHDAIASRISSLVRKIGFARDVALVGGVARNVGFVDALQRSLELDLLIPDDPEYVSSLGAALVAADAAASGGDGS